MSFEREHRYTIIKLSDAYKYLTPEQRVLLANMQMDISEGRQRDKRPFLRAVVVESDWPEYEPVWKMLEERCNDEG